MGFIGNRFKDGVEMRLITSRSHPPTVTLGPGVCQLSSLHPFLLRTQELGLYGP